MLRKGKRFATRPSRTERTRASAGSSTIRSWDLGHQLPSTLQPACDPFGFSRAGEWMLDRLKSWCRRGERMKVRARRHVGTPVSGRT